MCKEPVPAASLVHEDHHREAETAERVNRLDALLIWYSSCCALCGGSGIRCGGATPRSGGRAGEHGATCAVRREGRSPPRRCRGGREVVASPKRLWWQRRGALARLGARASEQRRGAAVRASRSPRPEALAQRHVGTVRPRRCGIRVLFSHKRSSALSRLQLP